MVDREAFTGKLSSRLDRGALSLGLGDLEGFHAINQEHGREAGDEVLRLASETLRSDLPDGSLLCRIGGDEFACVLPDTQPEEALLLLDEIRQHLGAKRLEVGKAKVRVGIRFGVAAFPQHAEDPTDLLRAAEQALHRATELGGSRVAMYVEDKMVLKSNYYPRAQLDRLARLADRLGRTEASLLRETLGDLLDRHRDRL